MKRFLLVAPLAAAMLTDVSAQPFVYEYCSANSLEATVADSTAMLIPKEYVTLNPDNVTYNISSTPFTYQPDSMNLICSDEPFYQQMHPIRGRTGFVVGSDLMVTSPHGPQSSFDPADFAIVFGLRATLSSGTCQQPDLAHVPASKVYFTDPVNPYYLHYDPGNGTDVYHGYPVDKDYLLFKLNRPVAGVTPLPLRRSGTPDKKDPLLITGHGNWLPLKIARDASIEHLDPLGLELTGVANYTGFSGAPVFGTKTELVETTIKEGSNNGYKLTRDPAIGCYRTVASFSNINGKLNNGDMLDFAAHVPIPPTELQLSPTETTVHYAPVGGSLTNAVTTFTIAPPPTATSTLTFRVGLPTLLPPSPSLSISPPPGDYSLSPGSPPLQFTVTATMGSLTSCKLVDTSIGVKPLNHAGFNKRVRHRFEVGMSDFKVTPSQIDAMSSLGAPYPVRTVEISNPYDHPSSIAVTPQAAWLRVNGAASATLNLAAAGSPGDRATVTLSFDDAAAGFPAFLESKTVNLVIGASPSASCGLHSPVTIPVTLTRGIETFSGSNPGSGDLPIPGAGQTFGAVTEFAVNVNENAFVVDDVDVSVRFLDDAIAAPLGPTNSDNVIKIELVAPDGTSAVLWDRNNAAPNYFVSEKFDLPILSGFTAAALKLDQSTTPPLGPGSLSVFNGHAGAGLWKVRLWNSHPTTPVAVPEVALRLTKQRQAKFYTFNTVYEYLPGPSAGQTFGPAADFFVDLSAEVPFRVDDIDLKLGFYESSPMYGASSADTLLRVELTSPANTTSVLWDRNNATAPYLGTETVNWLGGPVSVSTLGIDTTTTPPLGGGTLTTFNGQNGAGIWRVRLTTTDTSQRILPSHVNLLIGR
jgi:hypothetical protein